MDGETRYKRHSASCPGKTPFESRVSAVAFLRVVNESRMKGKAKLRNSGATVYQCAACLFYHIGHASPDDPIQTWV